MSRLSSAKSSVKFEHYLGKIRAFSTSEIWWLFAAKKRDLWHKEGRDMETTDHLV